MAKSKASTIFQKQAPGPDDDKYYRQQGKPYFNWHDFLEKDIDELSHDEMRVAKDLAGEWVTCAVGSQCAIIPRKFDVVMQGQPLDPTLNHLGIEFYHSITRMKLDHGYGEVQSFHVHRDDSKLILSKIEQRSAEIIAAIKANQEKL
jgi:hypothetical protein